MNDLQVIIDVGAKETTYPLDYPHATCYLFEPNPAHFVILQQRFNRNPNVTGYNYGLGEIRKTALYNFYLETFIEGGAYKPGWGGDINLPIETLDWFIEENNITRIDLLKIDTEGYDINVLQGGKKAIELARYIQFETWDNLEDFKSVIGDEFIMTDIGERNIFCTRQ